MIAAFNSASRERKRPEVSSEHAELQGILDAELARLPETLRAVIVLCDLQGKTRAEAATELKCPEGTVAARLHRGRKKLAVALSRRGLATGHRARRRPDARRRFRRRESLGCRQCLRLRLSRDPGTGS